MAAVEAVHNLNWPQGFSQLLSGDELKRWSELKDRFDRAKQRYKKTPTPTQHEACVDILAEATQLLKDHKLDPEKTVKANRALVAPASAVDGAEQKRKVAKGLATDLLRVLEDQGTDLRSANASLAEFVTDNPSGSTCSTGSADTLTKTAEVPGLLSSKLRRLPTPS